MSLTRVSAPAVLAIDEGDVFDHLRLILDDNGDPDPSEAALVRLMIAAAVDRLDGADGLLARALVTQSWMLRLPCFRPVIRLPLPPLQAVTAVKYLNTGGTLTTLDTATYVVAGVGNVGTVRPVAGTSWPATAAHPEAVEVTFRAGYGDTASAIPAPIRGALMEMIADRYAFRESASAGGSFSRMPTSAQASLSGWTDWGLVTDGA